MTLISAAEVAAMRADLEQMLPDTCAISRSSSASDGGGGEITTWPVIASDVPCRLTPALIGGSGRPKTMDVADRLNDITTHIVTVAAGTNVQQGDRITIDGQPFEALIVGTGGAWELARHVEARPVV